MENRIQFLCERIGWKFKKNNETIILSFASPKYEFAYIMSLASEHIQKHISQKAKDFDIDTYAYNLQNEYMRTHPSTLTPPVIDIVRFSETVSQKLNALSNTLSSNLNLDPFEERIVVLAEDEGFNTIINRKMMSDDFEFWHNGKMFYITVEHQQRNNNTKRAEILAKKLLTDAYNAESFSNNSNNNNLYLNNVINHEKNLAWKVLECFSIKANSTRVDEKQKLVV